MIEKLTEEYLKDNLIEAYFINDERTRIEVLSLDEDKKSQIATVIPYDTENDQCQALLTQVNLDALHENTQIKLKNDRENFEKLVISIAKKDGLINEKNTKVKEIKVEKSFTEILKTVFLTEHDYNSENIKEQLFKAKLFAFEMDHIKDSDDRDLKAKLRKSKTIKDVFKIVSQF